MKIGKLPEPMLIRSVLKEVKHRREEILVGPAVGQDCAVFEPKEGDVLVFFTDPITGTVKDIGSHNGLALREHPLPQKKKKQSC